MFIVKKRTVILDSQAQLISALKRYLWTCKDNKDSLNHRNSQSKRKHGSEFFTRKQDIGLIDFK